MTDFVEDANCKHYAGSLYDSHYSHCMAYRWTGESHTTCCCNGQVHIYLSLPPPNLIPLYDVTANGQQYLKKNIVAYNNLFSLSSLGFKQPNYGVTGFRPTFKIQGKMYHRIGSLLQVSDQQHKFAQLYFHDSHNELSNRMAIMQGLPQATVDMVQTALHDNNTYTHSFKAAL